MKQEDKSILHIITKTGIHKTIPFPIENHINESEQEKYVVDDDWYLSHGYTDFGEAIKEIEGKYYGKIK